MDSILIIGTGALATLFAARLAASGVDVTMLGTWQAGLAALAEDGARLDDATGSRVRVINDPSDCKEAKYALVLVKTWQTERAAQQLEICLAENGLAVTLQNGLGNYEILENILGQKRVGRGITTLGATLLAPGHAHLGGYGKVFLEKQPHLSSLVRMMRIANFEIETSNNVQALIWGKLVINAAINPLTALLRIKNGGLLENSHVHNVMGELASEAASVAKACGIVLPFPDPESAVEKVARQSADNMSSMLQDVLRGAPTEVDAINGMIVRLGEKNNVSVPVNRVIWSLVNSLSVHGNIYRLSTGGV